MHARVERIQPPPAYDTIVARAFAASEKLLDLTAHLLADGGQVLAMTASTEYRVGDVTANGFRVAKQKKLSVPGENADRNIVIFEPIISP
jgi:16S rRNA (guanine527-N7)-methyltransferase